MSFDPTKHLIDIKGKKYLPVAQRIQWFRDAETDPQVEEQRRPRIETKLVSRETGWAIFEASIYDARGWLLATGYGSETKDDWKDYLEKAETKAIGRALAAAGYGTQFTDDFDLDADGNKVVDAPQSVQRTTNFETGEIQDGEPVVGPDQFLSPYDQKVYDPGICEICSKKVPAKSVSFSLRKFNRVLCYDHQQEYGKQLEA